MDYRHTSAAISMPLRLFTLILSLLVVGTRQRNITLSQPTVILVSYDGFRWDYLRKSITPNFEFIAKRGVQAEYIENVFPTKTLPNHYSIVTGLFPESHGIVNNDIFDPDKKMSFRKHENQSFWWDAGEPLWVTNQRQGKRSAVLLWPWSSVKIRGILPDYFLPMSLQLNMSLRERIDKLVDNLKGPNPPSFLAMYYREPDHTGHVDGLGSQKLNDLIRFIDNSTGYLLNRLREQGLIHQVNLIITSDHGMASTSKDRLIFLNDYVNSTLYKLICSGATGGLIPHAGQMDNVYKMLKDKHPHMAVYKREDVPKHFHYSHNKRIPPIVLIPDEGWLIFQKNSSELIVHKGEHGYSNRLKSMHPIFLAHGPAFKSGYKTKPFKSIDIYPLVCKILGLVPAPCNGSFSRVRDMLKQEVFEAVEEDYTLIAVVGLIVSVTCLFMVYGLVKFCIRQRCPSRKYNHIYDLSSDYDL